MASANATRPTPNAEAARRAYDAGRSAAAKNDIDGAIRHFVEAVNAASVNDRDVWVSGDIGHRAAYNLGLLASSRGLQQAQAAKAMAQNGGSVSATSQATLLARDNLNIAARAFDAARADSEGKPLATPDAHVRRAAIAIGRANLDTVTRRPGTFAIRMLDGRPSVDSDQIRDLATARAALDTAERVAPQAVGIEFVPDLRQQLATWRTNEGLQRIQSVGAIAAGAIAALSDATNRSPPSTVTTGAAASLAQITSYSQAIRESLDAPDAAALRQRVPTEEAPAWGRMWMQYFDAQVADTRGPAAESAKAQIRAALVMLNKQVTDR